MPERARPDLCAPPGNRGPYRDVRQANWRWISGGSGRPWGYRPGRTGGQMGVKRGLEPALERIFHPDSYGYRQNQSTHEVLRPTREVGGPREGVLDLDLPSYLDSIDPARWRRAVRRPPDQKGGLPTI